MREQDNTIISTAAEELVMRKSEAQMNVHLLAESKDRVMNIWKFSMLTRQKIFLPEYNMSLDLINLQLANFASVSIP